MTGYGSVVPRIWEFIGSVLGTGVRLFVFYSVSPESPGKNFELGRQGYGSVYYESLRIGGPGV